MTPTEIIITNILPTGTAFAVLASDITQNVFIPSKLAHGADIRVSDTVLAQIVPNITHSDKTPWIAISLQGDAGMADYEDITGLVIADLEEGDASIDEIAKSIGKPVQQVRDALSHLISNGKVGRFELFGLVEVE